MPIGTLSRILIMVVTGGFLLLAEVCMYWSNAKSLVATLNQLGLAPELLGVWMTVALALTALFLGTVVAATSDVLTRPIVRAVAGRARTARLAGQSVGFSRASRWRKRLVAARTRQDRPLIESADIGSLAAAEMYQRGTEEHTKWAINEYAIYILASDLLSVVVLVLLQVTVRLSLGKIEPTLWLWSILAGLLTALALVILGTGRYLYAYEVVFRLAYLHEEKKATCTDEEG